MIGYQVDRYTDVNLVLAELRAGNAVMAALGPLRGTRVEREVKADLLAELARLAVNEGADVRELDRVRVHRFGRRRAMSRCLVSPRSGSGGPVDAGVREPRRPPPGDDSLSAAMDLPRPGHP